MVVAVLPLTAVVIAGAAWGAFYALAKLATTAGVHPIGLALWEGIGAGLLVYAACLWRHQPPPIGLRQLGFYAVSGLLGLTVPAVAFFFVARNLPVGVTTLLFTLVPILTYGLSLGLGLERFVPRRALGLLAGLVGVLLMLLPETSLPDRSLAVWVLVGVGANLLYAAQLVYIGRHTPVGVEPLATAWGTLTIGGLLLLPALVIPDSLFLPSLPPDPATWYALGIAGLSAVATLLLFWLIETAGPVYAAQTAYSTMIAGVLWGMVLFGERLSPWVWAALALMVVGVALVGHLPPVERPARS